MEVKDEWYEAQFGGHRNTRLQQRQPLTLIFLFTFQSSNYHNVVLMQRQVFNWRLLAHSCTGTTGRRDALIFASETEQKTRDKEQDYAQHTTY